VRDTCTVPFGYPVCCKPDETCLAAPPPYNQPGIGKCVAASCNGQGPCALGTTCVSSGCCDSERVCGDFCCDPYNNYCPNGGVPCEIGGFGPDKICCKPGETCFPATTSPNGSRTIGQCCPNERRCGNTCCPADQLCSGGTCCPQGQAGCGGNCCPPGSTCCGLGDIVGGVQTWGCCPVGSQCCWNGDNAVFQCCPPAETGWQCLEGGGGCYCGSGHCSGGSGSCPPEKPHELGSNCLTDSQFQACIACTVAWTACRTGCAAGTLLPCQLICDQSRDACYGAIGGFDPQLALFICTT
jgi:hypothetical protein